MSIRSAESEVERRPVRRGRRRGLRYREHEDRRELLLSRLLAFLTIFGGVGYLTWLTFNITMAHPVVAVTFFAAEVACLVLFVIASFTVWRLRYKPPEGLPLAETPSADVFVTVCGEPLHIVRATVEAAAAIEWPSQLTCYVLDDGGSEVVRQLAEGCGCRYLSRLAEAVPLEAAKAGNLNFGLRHSTGELVLVLDADQVCQPSILRVLASYMRFPRVGFVQSRQHYLVPEGDPFFNLDRVFYEAVQLGYDNRDTVISCGSGVVYRRRALEENGGFTAWNLTEDLTTSYDLHSHGWRSFYYPYPLTTGLAPSDIWGVYRQRGQWALDTMRLFFWDNPLLKRNLRWRSRVNYLVIPVSYFSAGLVFPVFYIIPLWTYVTGGAVLAGNELEFALIRSLYFLSMAWALRLLFRKHEAGRQFQMLSGLFPVYLLATLRAPFYPPRKSPVYRANNANGRARKRKPHGALGAVFPQLTLLLAHITLPFYAIWSGSAEPRLILSNALISAIVMWSLIPVVAAALEKKVWPEQNRPYVFYGAPSQTDA
jgi:cellulose synthase (UDP-forming)